MKKFLKKIEKNVKKRVKIIAKSSRLVYHFIVKIYIIGESWQWNVKAEK